MEHDLQLPMEIWGEIGKFLEGSDLLSFFLIDKWGKAFSESFYFWKLACEVKGWGKVGKHNWKESYRLQWKWNCSSLIPGATYLSYLTSKNKGSVTLVWSPKKLEHLTNELLNLNSFETIRIYPKGMKWGGQDIVKAYDQIEKIIATGRKNDPPRNLVIFNLPTFSYIAPRLTRFFVNHLPIHLFLLYDQYVPKHPELKYHLHGAIGDKDYLTNPEATFFQQNLNPFSPVWK